MAIELPNRSKRMDVPIMHSIKIKVERHRNMNYLEMSVKFLDFQQLKVDMIGFLNIYIINNWLIIVSMCRVNVKGSQYRRHRCL